MIHNINKPNELLLAYKEKVAALKEANKKILKLRAFIVKSGLNDEWRNNDCSI